MLDIKLELFQWFISFLDEKTSGENEIVANKELAEKLQKPIIRKVNKIKVHLPFIDNIWDTDLADMQLISKINKSFKFSLCVIDIYIKYAWVIPLQDKKGIIFDNAFQKLLDKSNRKPNKIWVDKDSKFYSRSINLFLKNNAIETYSTCNEGKFAIAKRFIRILKNKIYKYMTSISKKCIYW